MRIAFDFGWFLSVVVAFTFQPNKWTLNYFQLNSIIFELIVYAIRWVATA